MYRFLSSGDIVTTRDQHPSWTSSLCEVEGHTGRKSFRFLTPRIFNSIWISWSVLTIMQNLAWAIIAGRTACGFDKLANQALVLLKRLSLFYNDGADLSSLPVAELLNINAGIVAYLARLSWNIQGWVKTWLIQLVGLLIVSVGFLSKRRWIVIDGPSICESTDSDIYSHSHNMRAVLFLSGSVPEANDKGTTSQAPGWRACTLEHFVSGDVGWVGTWTSWVYWLTPSSCSTSYWRGAVFHQCDWLEFLSRSGTIICISLFSLVCSSVYIHLNSGNIRPWVLTFCSNKVRHRNGYLSCRMIGSMWESFFQHWLNHLVFWCPLLWCSKQYVFFGIKWCILCQESTGDERMGY